jgi:hypothetical protein
VGPNRAASRLDAKPEQSILGSMNDLGEPAGGPTLARVRRRGESHLLALMSAAAFVFVAIAIAKPWGESAPPPGASAATPSLVAETAQPVVNVTILSVVCTGDTGSVGTGDHTVSIYIGPAADGTYTTPLTPSATALAGSFAAPRVSPWAVVGAQPVIGLQGTVVCTGANGQVLEWVVPSPSAPDPNAP